MQGYLRSSSPASRVAQGSRAARSSPSRRTLIVPAASTRGQRQAGQAGVLFARQLRNHIRGDVIFSVRHRSNVALASRTGPYSGQWGCRKRTQPTGQR
jgi:hypothetical protein